MLNFLTTSRQLPYRTFQLSNQSLCPVVLHCCVGIILTSVNQTNKCAVSGETFLYQNSDMFRLSEVVFKNSHQLSIAAYITHLLRSLSYDRSVASSKAILHRVQCSASSSNFQYFLLSLKPLSSCLRLLPLFLHFYSPFCLSISNVF